MSHLRCRYLLLPYFTLTCAWALAADAGLPARTGPCPAGGALSDPAPPYQGSPGALLRKLPPLARQHAAATKGGAPWLTRLAGPASPNLLYRDGPHRVLVLDSCAPHDCGTHAVLVGYDLVTHDYGLVQFRDHAAQPHGPLTPPVAAALRCAKQYADAARGQALSTLDRVPW